MSGRSGQAEIDAAETNASVNVSVDDPTALPLDLELEPSPLEPDIDHVDRADLGRQVRGGMSWSLLNSIVLRFGSLAVGIVMARILVPANYGLFAVGVSVLAVLQSMNELGTSVAVVRWKGDVARPARTATTLAYLSSFILWASTFLLAPAVASAMNAPGATMLLRVLSFSVLIDAVSAIPNALVTREFLQGRRALVDAAGLIVSSAVSIVLALRGWGAMSMAWGAIAGNVVATVGICVLAPAFPRPGWNRKHAKDLLQVGLPLAGTSLVFLVILNVDYIVVGHELDAELLGFYLFAFNLASWPPNILSVAVRRVAVPAFARLSGDREGLNRAFCRAANLLGIASLLFALLLALLGPQAVQVVYGEKWVPATEALRWLAILGAARVLIDLGYDALAAAGRTSRLLLLQLAWIGLLIPGLVLGTRHGGIRGAGIAHAVIAVGFVIPAYVFALRRIGVRPMSLAHAMGRVLLACVMAAAVIVPLRSLPIAELGTLFVAGSAGTIVFLAVAVRRDDWRSVRRWVTAKLAARRLATAA
jgi:O-antigen/teichoic acid export membrane protein